MKKIILILLSLLMALTLVSCEGNHDSDVQNTEYGETDGGTVEPADTADTAELGDTATDPAETQSSPTQTPSDETSEILDKYAEYGTLVDAEALNVRSGAGSAFTRLGVLRTGDTVEILEKNCEKADGYTWHKILYQGSVGYVIAGNKTDNFHFEFRHLSLSDDGSTKSEAVSFEKYIGTWYDGCNPPDSFTVIQKDNGEIQCEWGKYRLTTFYLTITVKDGEFSFEDDRGRMSGKIDFRDDYIYVKVEETLMEGSWPGTLFNVKEENTSESSPITFVSEQERLLWKDKIERVLSENQCYENSEFDCLGVALMDVTQDHIPEVLVAYAGGSMGNVCVIAHDLESGEQVCGLGETPHYRDWNNIYLCVYENAEGKRLIVNEGSLRDGLEWYLMTSVLTEELKYDILFEEVIGSDESRSYYCSGQKVDQTEFEKRKAQFGNEYKEITETQVRIVYWDSIDAKNKNEAISLMADALVHSEQQFIADGEERVFDDYRSAYLDFLKDKKDIGYAFALVFIDGDEIPELYMSGISEAEGDVICSFRNGVVIEQHLSRNGGGKYVEKSGKIINQNGHMGYYYTHAYTLDAGGFTETLNASYIERVEHIGNDEYNFYYEYYINGHSVSETDYQNAVNSVFDFSNALSLYDDAESYDKIVEQLQNGNPES